MLCLGCSGSAGGTSAHLLGTVSQVLESFSKHLDLPVSSCHTATPTFLSVLSHFVSPPGAASLLPLHGVLLQQHPSSKLGARATGAGAHAWHSQSGPAPWCATCLQLRALHLAASAQHDGWAHENGGWMAFDPKRVQVDTLHFEDDTDWKDFCHDAKEESPPNAPESRSQAVKISVFVGANHAGNIVVWGSHTGILTFAQHQSCGV